MLDNIYTAVTDLPVIIQGALGSALFAAILFAGQRVFAYSTQKLSSISKDRKRRYLIEQQIKYNVLAATAIPDRGAFVSLLIYRASRSLFKALIWLTAGLMFGNIDTILALVGYFGCFYYLFIGLNTVTAPEQVSNATEKINEIRLDLEKLNDI